MGDGRARRRSRPEQKEEPLESTPPPRAVSSRRRSRPERVKEEEVNDEENQDEVMEEGHETDLVDSASGKRNGKRKRDHKMTKPLVRTSDAYLFFDSLLQGLMKDPDCEHFLLPVLTMWKEEEVPEYRERIKKPMDLGTVQIKLKDDRYTIHSKIPGEYIFDDNAMACDLRLIFENCMEYNEPKSSLYEIAKKCLDNINKKVTERKASLARQQEKQKRDSERKRRKVAEEEAANAGAAAQAATAALAKAKKDAEDAERKRNAELKRREAEWARRNQAEKEAAVAAAVQEVMAKQRREGGRHGKLVNTSSVSSDEHEGIGEVTFTFVSTAGMEKKRGRKSALVMDLEAQHDTLMKRRRGMVEMGIELEKMKQIDMTYAEKKKICTEVEQLDFVRMKGVVDMIARGMNRPDIFNEVEIDLDIDHIDNVVLREIQFFLRNPGATTAKDALQHIESEISDIETRLVEIRYQKVS